MKNHLIITSGPSCVGKSPLVRALQKFYPDVYARYQKLVIYNSRKPRPGEIDGIDYFFRTRRQIEQLKRKKDFIVINVRGDIQAVDLAALAETIRAHNVLFEGNPFIHEILKKRSPGAAIPMTSVFIAPLSREEILFLKNLPQRVSLDELITDIMRRKLLRRTAKQKGILSLPDLENIEVRAKSAPNEMRFAWNYDYILPNHDGEDSDNWDAFYYPLAEARKTLEAFVEILNGKDPRLAERWEKNLLTA